MTGRAKKWLWVGTSLSTVFTLLFAWLSYTHPRMGNTGVQFINPYFAALACTFALAALSCFLGAKGFLNDEESGDA